MYVIDMLICYLTVCMPATVWLKGSQENIKIRWSALASNGTHK